MVTGLIKDGEGKDGQIIKLEQETKDLKHKVKALKEAREQDKVKCENKKVQEYNYVPKVGKNAEKADSSLSSFRFEFSQPAITKATNATNEIEEEEYREFKSYGEKL